MIRVALEPNPPEERKMSEQELRDKLLSAEVALWVYANETNWTTGICERIDRGKKAREYFNKSSEEKP